MKSIKEIFGALKWQRRVGRDTKGKDRGRGDAEIGGLLDEEEKCDGCKCDEHEGCACWEEDPYYKNIKMWESIWVEEMRRIARLQKYSQEWKEEKSGAVMKVMEALWKLDGVAVDKLGFCEEGKEVEAWKSLKACLEGMMKKCKKDEEALVGEELFDVWNEVVDVLALKYDVEKRRLYDTEHYEMRVREKDVEEAERVFGEFAKEYYRNAWGSFGDADVEVKDFKFGNDTLKIIKYKGVKIYEYVPWEVGFVRDEESGEIKVFYMQWDWWYPVDRWLWLERGWKKEDEEDEEDEE